MKILYGLLLISTLLAYNYGYCQPADSLNSFQYVEPPCNINQIVIVGNKMTKDVIIRRQIDFEKENIIHKKELDEIKYKVFSLDLFNSVETYVQSIRGDTILFIDVNEKIFFFPVPYFDIVDQDWSKLNLGIGLAHINLFGENKKIYGVGWLGYNPGFSISFLNPWFGKNHFLLGGNIYRSKILNRLYPLTETHFGASAKFGKHFSIYSTATIGLSVDQIELSDNFVFYSGSDIYRDMLYKIEGSLVIDRRNNIFFPTNGYYANVNYYYAFWKRQREIYQNMELDLRYYLPVGESSVIGIRSLGVRRSSHQPVNDYLLLGYRYRIRGYFDYVSQGIWLNISTLSFRFPLFPIRYFSLPPLYGYDVFKKVPFGVSMSVFTETGFLVDDFFKLKRSDFLSGFGAGLIFHLPYANVARFDIAVNDKFDNYDLIFLIGVAF